MDAILFWNGVCLDANKIDFTTDKPEINPAPEQGGPTRTSRAFAIVHLAMYDAYIAIAGGGKTYLMYSTAELPSVTGVPAAQAAVAAAACQTLIALFPRQRDRFVKQHLDFMTMLGSGDPGIEAGLAWGRIVAAKMLAARANDGSNVPDDQYAPSAEPGKHRVDPLNPGQKFLGPLWGQVSPFGINNLTAVVPGTPPPAMTDARYTSDFAAVASSGALNSTTRTQRQTAKGLFWAYDGARNIGLPPRLYNQVVRAITTKLGTVTEQQNARLFAMINVAMADAGIQCWHEKYIYNLWRPVLGVREADPGWGPTGKGDGNSATQGDPYWLPFGAPRTNQPGMTSFTPHFPAYPSGHASFGTAALHLAEKELALPKGFTFEFVSDELNGESIDRDGSVRTRFSASMTIADAIEENVLSRVYLGVHWEFDGREGAANGRIIADKIQGAFPDRA